MLAECSIPDCAKPVHGRGWCPQHYARWLRNGSPLGGRAFHGEPLDFLYSHLTNDVDHCILWPYGRNGSGYGSVKVEGIRCGVHVLACERTHGPKPEGMEVCHSCGNGHLGCFNPRHLRWDTHKENALEGRRTRLTWDKVDAIRNRFQQGDATRVTLASDYGITSGHVGQILRNERWVVET